VIVDAGFLIAVDRGEEPARSALNGFSRTGAALHTSHAVVAQVWRSGARQARLSALLKSVAVHPLDDGRLVGSLLARGSSADVVDAHLVALALELGQAILTGDPDDLAAIAAPLGRVAPAIYAWP
jgi:predicted nucleic acid-binding protein